MRCNKVDAHGDEAGFHKELYAKAHMKIMTAKNCNEAYMENTVGDTNVLAEVTAIEKTGEEGLLQSAPRSTIF